MEQLGEIRALAQRMAGDQADADVLNAMCDAAAAEIAGRLRQGVSPEELGSTYVTAVGVLALAMYSTVADVPRLRSFRAGDVSADYGGGTPNAEELRALAEQLLAGQLTEQGFGFVEVAG